jgi:hypothetical protein
MDPRAASHWWAMSGDAQAAAVWNHLTALEGRERLRIARDQINERIYSSNVSGTRGGVDIATLLRSVGFQAADLNFARQIIDALVARIGNNQPAIRPDADGADWTMRRQAKLIDKLLTGEMEQLDMQAEAPLALRSALVTRGGAIKITAHKGDIVGDRVPVDEFRMDDREARYGKPRQLHHVKQVAREVLLRDFPEHAGAIRDADPAKRREGELEEFTGLGGETNMVDVAESWHLPSHKDADDGVRLLSIRGRVLDTEKWTRPRFPVAFIRWSPPQRGFWGCSLMDELAALQFKVNELARDLLQNVYFTSALAVFTRRNADISEKKLAGKQPYTVEVDNPGDIQFVAPDGFSPAQFQLLQWLIQQMYEVSGVSQLMAQSKNPLGAGASGAALSEFYDIESERFSQLELAYARLWRDCGRLIIDAAQDLSQTKEFKRREVRWVKRGVIQRVKWGDVKTDLFNDDRYQLRLEAAGYMPKTRSGKLQAVEQLIAGGFLDPKWAPSLLDFPDLEQANMIRQAPVEFVIAAMEDILDCEVDEDGMVIDEKSADMPTPIPEADLELCMAVGKALVLQQTAEKAPEGVIRRARLWCELVDVELQKGAQAANLNATAGMGGAMAPDQGTRPGAAPMMPAMPMGPMSPEPLGPTGLAQTNLPDLGMAAA